MCPTSHVKSNMNLISEAVKILGEAEASDPAKLLSGFSVGKLRNIIKKAIADFDLDKSWGPSGNSVEDLVNHIDEMCNEFGLRVQSDGSLKKA